MSSPKVTVCVPVFNTARYIKQCIESVFAQEFKDWVLLVSDNCSTDGTWEILQQFRHPQMRLSRQPKNLGPVANWNFLLEKAQTDYFCFLGSDDYFYPNHLENKMRLLDQFPEAPFVHGSADYVNETGALIHPGHVVEQSQPTEESSKSLEKLLQVNYINITTVLFRRKALTDSNLMFDSRLRFFIDWQLYVDLMLRHPFVLGDPRATAVYRVHSASEARQNLNNFPWSYESARFRVDSLKEHSVAWKKAGVNPEAQARALTDDLWKLAFQQSRRGNFANARLAWRFFREFHSPLVALWNLPEYVKNGFQKLKS